MVMQDKARLKMLPGIEKRVKALHTGMEVKFHLVADFHIPLTGQMQLRAAQNQAVALAKPMLQI